MSQVYRCSRCEALVAYEYETKQEPPGTNLHESLFGARTFNVQEEDGCVICARCGNRHYTINELCVGSSSLTLDDVFTKSPLRVLLFLRAQSSYFYKMRTYRDPDGRKNDLGYLIFIDEYTYDEKQPGVLALNQLYDLCPRLCSDTDVEIEQRNVIYIASWERGEGEKARDTVNTSNWPCANKFEWYTKYDLQRFKNEVFGSTYDFVLFLHLEWNDFMKWTDSNAVGIEEFVVMSWLCSGGNLLFGQWGTPKAVGKLNGSNINIMKDVVEVFRGDVDDTNNQNTLADLAEWGHFLGWWGQYNRFPTYAEEKVKRAVIERWYKTWKFRKDFPHFTFTYTHRRNERRPRVLDMKDAFTKNEVYADEDEQSLYGIVRKNSRVLFREGYNFFQRLLQKTLGKNNQEIISN